ncbi:MAG: prealbumin-like fold domain-containing protein, partial [Coriobacteriia bacterium]|nr:prealbumin-like fold domain-containing protein [Coriobacteriia bacterium]
TRVGTLPPTDAQGRTNSYNMDLSFWANPLGGNPSGLPLGDYTLVEIVAPAGHVIDPTPIPVRLTSANMSDAPRPGNHTHPQYEYYAVANVEWENITTIPQQRPVLVVQKADSETGEPSAQGGATLEGAQFRVEFFGGFAPVENRDPARTWILRTGADGAARLDAEHLVSGDPFFIADGHVTLPLGTIRIQEIAAPTGYLINPEVFVRQITQESMGSEIAVYVPPVVDQQVARGDLELVKIAERTHERLEGVPFRITSYTTGESNIIVTDANGQASTAASWNTRIAETVNRGELATDGVWFGYRPAMSNAKGALPFDTYIIEELRAPSNEGFDLIEPFRVVISRDAVTINLGTLTNHPETESGVRISTQAHTGDRTTQTFRPGDEVDMHDEVRIEHIELEEGTPRAFRAWLFSRLDGEVSLVWASEYIEYTVENVIMSFTVNEVIDTSLFDPRTEFFYAETAYGQRDGEDGPEWERDYSHNFCGSDNRQTLWPDEDTPYTPQETDPAPEVESEEGSASEPSTSTAAGSARTPGLPRLGDVVDAWPLLLVFAGSMLFSMFAGYKFGVRVATPTLATAGASSKVTPADVKSDKPKSKPSKSVGKTDGKGSKKDDKADKDDKKDAKAKTAKPKDESDGKKEDESKDKSIKKKAKPSKKEDKSS